MANITVIGAANIDISATPYKYIIPHDSNPGRVNISYGGVGRNIAHNLCLFGNTVNFISAFSNDDFGRALQADCKRLGMNLHLSHFSDDERSCIYLCINNEQGDMQSAVADVELTRLITPDFLAQHIDEINQSDAVVLETNISEESIAYVLANCTAPLFIDTVSTTKAKRLGNAMQQVKIKANCTIKTNLLEAQILSDTKTPLEASEVLSRFGVKHLYVTLGGDGVFCYDMGSCMQVPAVACNVVNTTGAGDAFLAGIVQACSHHESEFSAVRFGLKVAAATLQSTESVNPDIAQLVQLH